MKCLYLHVQRKTEASLAAGRLFGLTDDLATFRLSDLFLMRMKDRDEQIYWCCIALDLR